jgi:hypothetical protein
MDDVYDNATDSAWLLSMIVDVPTTHFVLNGGWYMIADRVVDKDNGGPRMANQRRGGGSCISTYVDQFSQFGHIKKSSLQLISCSTGKISTNIGPG